MKKILAMLLICMMTLSMAACGENADNKNDPNNTEDPYKTFEDLTVEWDINSDYLLGNDDVDGQLYIHCNAPADLRIESLIYGFVCNKANVGTIVVSSGEYTPGLTVENAFADVYDNYFISTLNSFNRNSDWLDFTPDTKENVTINGRTAVKFAGVQNAEDYSTPYSYDVYGYCIVIENVPVVIAAVAGEQNNMASEDNMTAIKHYVDEMIYTVRAFDHYEDYGYAGH